MNLDDKKVGAGAGSGSLSDPTLVAAMATMLGVSDFTSTAACGPVKAFQLAYNSAGNVPAISVDGGYGAETANAASLVAASNGGGNVPAGLSSGWPNCGGSPVHTCPAGQHWDGTQCVADAPITPPSGGLPTWAKWLIYLLITAGAIGAGIWLYRYFGKKNAGAMESKRRPRRRGKRKGKKR